MIKLFNGVGLEGFTSKIREKILNGATEDTGRMFIKGYNDSIISISEDGTSLRFKNSSQIVIREVEGIDDIINIKLYKEDSYII